MDEATTKRSPTGATSPSPLPSAPTDPAVNERGNRVGTYTEHQVTEALRHLVSNGGNLKKTAEEINEAGLTLTRDTLKKWRDQYFPARYAEIRREQAAYISEQIAGNSLERALQADEVEAQLIDDLAARKDELAARDIAPAVRSLAQAKASDIEKAQLLRDRPTEIREHRSVGELMHVLNSIPGLIEGEIHDAEVVEDDG